MAAAKTARGAAATGDGESSYEVKEWTVVGSEDAGEKVEIGVDHPSKLPVMRVTDACSGQRCVSRLTKDFCDALQLPSKADECVLQLTDLGRRASLAVSDMSSEFATVRVSYYGPRIGFKDVCYFGFSRDA